MRGLFSVLNIFLTNEVLRGDRSLRLDKFCILKRVKVKHQGVVVRQ